MKIKQLDLYIIKKFLGTYIFAILLILAIIVMFDVNEKMDKFLAAPLSATIFDYYVNYLPYMANQFSPLFTFIADDFNPIEIDGAAEVDRIYSRAYLRHLFVSQELLAMQIASIHNLAFYLWLVGEARKHILAGDFKSWKDEMVVRVMQRL